MRRRDLDRPSGDGSPEAANGAGVLRPIRPVFGPAEVASRLAPVLTWEGARRVKERSWRLVARTDEFDAWLIAWPAGGRVELHDHGWSRGAISVINGRLVEAVPQRGDSSRLSLVTRSVSAGETLGFDADHVHDVVNEGPEPALSLHVYSPGLRSMTFYALEEDRLVKRRVGWAVDGAEEPAGRVAVAVVVRPVDELLAGARAAIERMEPSELERATRAARSWSTSAPSASGPRRASSGSAWSSSATCSSGASTSWASHSLPEVTATTSRSSWCARRAMRRAWPRTRCTSWVSTGPVTWQAATGPGAAWRDGWRPPTGRTPPTSPL